MRNDGRADNKIRKIKIKRDYMKYAEGSCLLEMGDTKVLSKPFHLRDLVDHVDAILAEGVA